MFRFPLAILYLLPNLSKDVRRNVLDDILRIHSQHPDHTFRPLQIVDDSIAAALSPASRSPTKFPYSTSAWDYGPLSGAPARSHCSSLYSSSVRYSWTSRVKSFVSMKLNTFPVYGNAVYSQALLPF